MLPLKATNITNDIFIVTLQYRFSEEFTENMPEISFFFFRLK